MNILITGIIALLGAFTLLIPLFGKLSYKVNGSIKFTKRGKWFILVVCFSIFIAMLSVFKTDFDNSNNERNRSDELQKIARESRERDSINVRQLISRYDTALLALGEFHIEYVASSKKFINILKDSIRNGPDPSVYLCSPAISQFEDADSYNLTLYFCSINSPIDVKVDYALFSKVNGKLEFQNNFTNLVNTNYLPDNRYIAEVKLSKVDPINNKKLTEVYFLFKTNLSSRIKKMPPVYQLYEHSFKNRITSPLSKYEMEKAKALIPNH